jgi:hypothetical protein
MTKINKVIDAFVKGEVLTSAQIRSRFRLQNPTATIAKIRNFGYDITGSEYMTRNGGRAKKYSLGRGYYSQPKTRRA